MFKPNEALAWKRAPVLFLRMMQDDRGWQGLNACSISKMILLSVWGYSTG